MLLIVILVLAVPSSSQLRNGCSNKYTVRLDRNSSAGRLQICWSEEEPARLQWYSVCNVLNGVATAVVCRQLGFNRARNRDHEAVIFLRDCADGVQLQCSRSDTHVQNCTISEPDEDERNFLAGVICDASPQEIQSCVPASPSIPPQRTRSPPACQTIIPTTTTEQTCTPSFCPIIITHSKIVTTHKCPMQTSTTESLQSSSIAQTKDGMQEKGQSCSSEASRTYYNCGIVGGVLGVVIGILAIVVVGLLIGWIHDHRNSKRYKITEQPHDSHFINPTYGTTARPITTSRSNQQTTPTGRSGTNPSRGEGDTAGPLYQVLGGPLPVESVDHTYQQLRKGEEGQDYDVVSEDIVGISYKVPITTRNKTEQFEEEHQENDQDYSMVNDFTTERKSYKVPVQLVKVGQSQEEQKEKVNGRQT